jgi:uncharacterized protein
VRTPPAAGLDGASAWPARHPWTTIVIALVAALAALVAVRQISVEASLERMLAQDDPSARAVIRVLNDFAAVDDLLILVTQPASDLPNISPLLSFAQRFERAARALPERAELVHGITYRLDNESRAFFEEVLVPAGVFYLTDDELERLRQRLSTDEIHRQIERSSALMAAPGPAAEALARALVRDPLRLHEFVLDRLAAQKPFDTYAGTDAFISADGEHLLIRVTGARPPSNLEFSKQLTSTVSELVEQVNADNLEVHISGAYAIAAASERSIRRDMIASVVGSIIMLQLFFLLAFRRPLRTFLFAFGPVALGVLYGFGGYGLLGHDLTPMTAVIGAILAGMGIDYTIHFIAHYRSVRDLGALPAPAAASTLRSLTLPLMAAWVTSVFGFAAIGWSSIQATRDFALLGAIGLGGALVGAMAVLPALLVITGRRDAAPASASPGMRLSLEPLLECASRWRAVFVLTMVAIAVAASAIIVVHGDELLPLESDLTVMHPRPNPPLEAQKLISDRMGSAPETLIVHLQAPDARELLALAHDVQERLDSKAMRELGIASSYGLATLLPDPHATEARAAAFSDAEAQRIVDDLRGAVEQSVFNPVAIEPYAQFLHRLLTRHDAPGVDALVPYEQLAGSLLPRDAVDAGNEGATQAISLIFLQRPLIDRASKAGTIEAIRAGLADLPGATLTGLTVIGHDTEATIHRDLPRLMGIALGVVAIYLLIHFRSLIDAILALVPTLMSLLCLLAFMHLSHAKLNMVNLVSIPLLIGIAVDYGIFLVSHARWRTVGLVTPAELMRKISPTCHAIVISAVTTMLGFGSLIFTSVPAIQSLGLTVGVGVISALAAATCLLVPIYGMKARASEKGSIGWKG